MAAYNVVDSITGLELEEQLFVGVASGSLEQYKGLLKALDDVDVRVGRQRTLLHLGIKMGKLDWVEGLLAEGADPGLRDGDQVTAVDMAEEISARCPEDNERLEILRLNRLVHRRECAMKRRRALRGGDVCSALSNELSLQLAAVSSLKDSVNALRREMSVFRSRIKESFVEMKSTLSERDVLLRSLESSITSSVEVMSGLKECLEESTAMGTVIQSSTPPVDMRQDCVETMLAKTVIMSGDEVKVSRIRHFYEKLYDESDITSCLLKFLKGQSPVEIMFDCDSYNIGSMKAKFKDHDGVECDGSGWISFADFSEFKVYIAGKVDVNRKEEHVLALLSRSLAHMSLLFAFKNGGRPYERGNRIREAEFKSVLIEAEVKRKRGVPFDQVIRWALSKKTQLWTEIEFASNVPWIIARYGSAEGTSKLREQLPSLLAFFVDHVMATLLHNASIVGEKEDIPSEIMVEEVTCKEELLSLDVSQETMPKVAYGIKMGNLIDVKKYVHQNKAMVKKETFRGENLGMDESQERPVSNVACDHLEMGNLIKVKEEFAAKESLPSEENDRLQNLSENEAQERPPVSDTLCVPLMKENLVDGCSITNDIQDSNDKMLKALNIERQRNKEMKLKEKISHYCSPPGHFLKNKITHQCHALESIGTVQGDSFKDQNYILDTNIPNGTKKTNKRAYIKHMETQKYSLSDCADYICNDCGYKCPDKIKLSVHISGHILNKMTLLYVRQEKNSSQDASLKQMKIPEGLKPFKCETCGKGVTSKKNLVRHLASHSGLKPFKCETCGEEFTQKCHVVRHLVMHTGLKPFKCEICGEEFTQKCHVVRHLVTHTGLKPFKCEICGKKFAHKRVLVEHKVMHSGLKPYKCEKCGKEFAWRSSLVQHSAIHTGLKPFKCETCGKEFSKSSRLLRHSVLHSSLKQFKSEACGKEFAQNM